MNLALASAICGILAALFFAFAMACAEWKGERWAAVNIGATGAGSVLFGFSLLFAIGFFGG